MHRRYQSFQEIDGTLFGRQETPPGPYDVSSPSGLATIQHHYSQGMFGPNQITTDVYSGTGERYIDGEYGNLYKPHDHASITDYYNGPQSARTEYTTLGGRPYYWMNMDEEVTKKFVPITDRVNNLPHGDGSRIEKFEDFDLIGGNTQIQDTPIPFQDTPDSFNDTPSSYTNVSQPIGEPTQYGAPPSSSLSLQMRPQIRSSYSYKNILYPSQMQNNSPPPRQIAPGSISRNYATSTINNNTNKTSAVGGNIDVVTNVDTKKSHVEPPKHKVHPKSNSFSSVLIVFVVLLIGCIAFELWTETAKGFLQQNIHKGGKISWSRFLLYAVIASGILFLFMYLAGLRPNNILLSSVK